MRRVASLTFVMASLLLSGCGGGGGGGGCDSSVRYVANSAYAGNYTARFTPPDATTPSLTFAFTIAANGAAVGTVTNAGASFATTGTGADLKNGCLLVDTTSVTLGLTLADGVGRILTVGKPQDGKITGTFTGNVAPTAGGEIVTGTLVVAAA